MTLLFEIYVARILSIPETRLPNVCTLPTANKNLNENAKYTFGIK